MTSLPNSFLTRPIAHRGLHDRAQGRVENSLAAARAAIAAGYGIELDLQVSRDDVAMMFHDDALDRLTGEAGLVSARTARELTDIALTDGGETIPTFRDLLEEVAGQVPLLVELKDQSGAMGPTDGRLEKAVAQDIAGYTGDIALMSFNPHSVLRLKDLCPDVPRGITTCLWNDASDAHIPATRRAELAQIPDFDAAKASFISHDVNDLDAAPVARLKARDVPILCWTVRSADQERHARRVADNITFEGYTA